MLVFIAESFVADTRLLGKMRYAPSRSDGEAAAQVVALVSHNLEADWQRATAGGTVAVKAPEANLGAKTTGYLRHCNGAVVELCTRSPRDRA